MDSDALLVAGKELRELLASRSLKILILQMGFLTVVFGLLIPYSQGPYWIGETYFLSVHMVFVPLLVTFPFVADCFAGERERKTLETLLATRLSERALFLGKALSVFVFAYIQVVAVVLTGLVALNLYGRIELGMETLFLYSGPTMFAMFFVSAAVVVLGTGLGVLISLRSESVRSAQRVAGVINLVLFLPLFFGFLAFRLSWVSVLITLIIVLLSAGSACAIGIRSFQRERLVLGE